jgi:hypothetical protein
MFASDVDNTRILESPKVALVAAPRCEPTLAMFSVARRIGFLVITQLTRREKEELQQHRK